MASDQAQLDPVQLEAVEGHDRVPELPDSIHLPTAYGNAAHHNYGQPHSPSRESPKGVSFGGVPMNRRHSSSSYVSIDHFDPEGVAQLRRSLSRQSQNRPESLEEEHPSHRLSVKRSSNSVATDVTLTSPDGPFDFEKTLRTAIRKCVFFLDGSLVAVVWSAGVLINIVSGSTSPT